MIPELPLSNWSLNKTLASLPDALSRAKIQIFCFIVIANLIKIAINISDHILNGLENMIIRDIRGIIINILVIKILLSKPNWVHVLIHIFQSLSIILMSRYIFIDRVGVDIHIMFFILMNITFSFYGLGRKWGIFYSVLLALILVIYLWENVNNSYSSGFNGRPITIYYILIIIVDFAVISVSHYFFHNILYGTISEKELLNEKLEKSIKAQSNFISMMSHELRTPLNSVIGMADLLLDDKPNEDQKENLDILKFSAENLLIIINDILDFNKLDSDKIELENIPFNLVYLLENACAGFRLKASDKRLILNLNIDPKLTKQNVLGDPTRLIQIIYNLVGNAIKFTQKGKVSVKAKVVGQEEGLIKVLFSVDDTGIGISDEKQRLIFDPFMQASQNITREFGGTGLGLAIVKHLLHLYESDIHLESKENQGSHFYFNITFKTTDLASVINVPGRLSEKVSLNNLRVLLAEDNPMSVIFMKKLLDKWSVDCSFAGDGQQVVDMVTINNYDVILMDMHMPVMNGYEAASVIRQLNDPEKANIHIIALTASISDATLTMIMKSGMNDYLNKPFKPDELHYRLAKIHAALN